MEGNNLLATFAELEKGDKIQTDVMASDLKVTGVLDSVGVVELEGPRGGEKSLVQNKNNPEDIAMLTGADRKGFVSEIARV